MFMHIVLVSLSVVALALLLLVVPVLALQALLRRVSPPAAPRWPTARERDAYEPIEELPPQALELFRLAR